MLDFAAAVEAALQEPQPRIKVVDIGGGLSANYGSDEARPSHAELVATLRQVGERHRNVCRFDVDDARMQRMQRTHTRSESTRA